MVEDKEDRRTDFKGPSEVDEEDSEGDEVVDIERIEDREEDKGEDKETSQISRDKVNIHYKF